MFSRPLFIISITLLAVLPLSAFSAEDGAVADSSQNGFVSLWQSGATLFKSFDFVGGFNAGILARLKQTDKYLAENLYTSSQTAHTQDEYYAECSAGCSSGFWRVFCRAFCWAQSRLHVHGAGALGVGEGAGGPIATPINPSVSIDVGGEPSATVVGNAYLTSVPIYWEVQDSCGCTSSPGNWWNGTLDDGNDGNGTINVAFNFPGTTQYSLVCQKKSACSPHDTNRDTVTVTPDWNPSVALSGPESVAGSQTVYISYAASDIKTCTRSWTGGALTLSGGNQQTATLAAGTISRDTTFTLSCTGFDNQTYSASWAVDFISSPTPYLYINNINLILIGPGSGGKSNKTQIGVTSGGFVGTVTLSAAPEGGIASPLRRAGAQFKFGAGAPAGTVSCSAGSPSCSAVDFWVEIPGEIAEGVYNIIITADPAGSELASKTQTVPLRVRKFVPAFEEI